MTKTAKQETLIVLAHRARAKAHLPRPVPMKDILAVAGVSSQWWNQLSRGAIAEPDPDMVRNTVKALGVKRAEFDAALAETRRRADAGLEV